MPRHVCTALGVQIGGAMYVIVVLTQALARVCIKRVGGELRMHALNSCQKVVGEADGVCPKSALRFYLK